MEPFTGQIQQVGFNFAPQNWAMCQGQLIAISQNTALFSLLGTYYGGNGTTTFALPNLASRVVIGVGQSPGLSSYEIGEIGGSENVSLLQSNMPAHTHAATFVGTGGGGGGPLTLSLNAVQAPGTTAAPAAGSLLATGVDAGGNDTPQIYVPAGTGGTQVALGGLSVSGGGGITGGNVTNSVVGGSQPVSVLNPFIAITSIIALYGVFPSRG